MKISDLMGKTKKELIELWNKLPQREATHDMPLFPRKEDFKRGTPGDPFTCALAIYSTEALGCPMACFTRTEGILVRPNAQNELEKVRYLHGDKKLRPALEIFDGGGIPSIPPEGFLLKAPPPSQRVSSKKIYRKRHIRNVKAGKVKRRKSWRAWGQRKRLWVGTALRDATGLFRSMKPVGAG